MSLAVLTFTLGPLQTNSYLIADEETGQAVLIDPTFESRVILQELQKRQWGLEEIWMTHAHFDHFAGAGMVAQELQPPPVIGLHPADLTLWENDGGAANFGFRIPPAPAPSMNFYHLQQISVGKHQFQVRHTPGHTPGHVVFYNLEHHVVFCGDLIFRQSVGRTDLPEGDHQALIQSIQNQILTLPGETRLLSGHGDETTVAEELRSNPFI